MRRMGYALGLLVAVLFGLAGCTPFKNDIRPPKQPDQLIRPPEAEARFSLPPHYEDKWLKDNASAKNSGQQQMPGGPGGPPGAGGMGGMGGMGMPMGGMGGMGMPGMGGMGR